MGASLRASWSQSTTFADGTPFTNLSGFKISLGIAPGVYTQEIDVGIRTDALLPGLTPGQRYYMAVRAYDNLGNVSVYSTEVSAIALADIPAPGIGWQLLM